MSYMELCFLVLATCLSHISSTFFYIKDNFINESLAINQKPTLRNTKWSLFNPHAIRIIKSIFKLWKQTLKLIQSPIIEPTNIFYLVGKDIFMFWLGSGHCNFFVVDILYTKLKSKRRCHSFGLIEWLPKDACLLWNTLHGICSEDSFVCGRAWRLNVTVMLVF